jgi:Peptidase U49
MGNVEQVNLDPIKSLLTQVAPAKAGDLDGLFQRLNPVCELDRNQERILFQADAERNLIRIGLKCTYRLQAHALAAGVVIAGIGTPGFKVMSSEDRKKLLAPADHLLTWAVGRDLQQWLKKIEGYERNLDAVLTGAGQELPDIVLASLTRRQRVLGEGLFRYASAFILLHEFGHLNFGHRGSKGFWSIQQEKDADRFAAEWLLESATKPDREIQATRLNVLFGVSVALLWLTVFNVFLGPQRGSTHPEGYDRLFQVLDSCIDQSEEMEYQAIWYFVSTMLFIHMDCANYTFDPRFFQGDPRDEVNYLIDMISKKDRV